MATENGIPMPEPRMLKLTEIDGRHYLKLVDVERLLADIRHEIRENAACELLEDGKKNYHLTEAEIAVTNTLFFVSSCIRKQLMVTCETPDEIRAMHERIRNLYYDGKYYLSETTEEDGKPAIVYFRKYCAGRMAARLKEEGKSQDEIAEAVQEHEGDPAFTTDGRYAKLFESMEEADSNKTYLNHNYHTNLEVHPAFLLNAKRCRDVLDSILRGADDGGENAPKD